eukprot:1986886-Rhodomonas_salina.5
MQSATLHTWKQPCSMQSNARCRIPLTHAVRRLCFFLFFFWGGGLKDVPVAAILVTSCNGCTVPICRAHGSGFRVQGSGFRPEGPGFMLHVAGPRGYGLWLKVGFGPAQAMLSRLQHLSALARDLCPVINDP